MTRAALPPPVDPELPLELRTDQLVSQFDATDQGCAFDDSGEGTTYAQWFADLLDEWRAAFGA